MNWIQIVTAIIGGGGLVGAVSSLLIARRRADNLSVKTAEGALVVQERIVRNLTIECKRLENDHKEAKALNVILISELKKAGVPYSGA